MRVGDIERKDTGRLEVPEINFERLFCEEVDRDRVAGERVHNQEVVNLRGLAFEGEPAVAENDLCFPPPWTRISTGKTERTFIVLLIQILSVSEYFYSFRLVQFTFTRPWPVPFSIRPQPL